MALNNNETLKNKDRLAVIQILATKVDSLAQNIETAIGESTSQQATTSYGFQSDLCQNWEEVEAEHQKLKTMGIIENKRDLAFIHVLDHHLSSLCCSMMRCFDKDNKSLYKFDFGQNRSITMHLNETGVSLVAMSPDNPNIAKIQKFLHESQDFIGLLTCYAKTDVP